MERIRSRRNRHVVEAARLHRARRRRLTGRTILEGPHLIADALRAGIVPDIVFGLEISDVLREARAAGSELALVTDDLLRRVAGTEHPRGPVAVARIPPSVRIENSHCLALLDVADPGNVGTLIRAGAAFGLGVIAAGTTADPWSPKTIRAGAGAHFVTLIEIVSELDPGDLRSRGISPVATVARGGDPAATLVVDRPLGVMIGSEAHGLPSGVVESADRSVTIPTRGVESLNAAAAGAILAYVVGSQSVL